LSFEADKDEIAILKTAISSRLESARNMPINIGCTEQEEILQSLEKGSFKTEVPVHNIASSLSSNFKVSERQSYLMCTDSEQEALTYFETNLLKSKLPLSSKQPTKSKEIASSTSCQQGYSVNLQEVPYKTEILPSVENINILVTKGNQQRAPLNTFLMGFLPISETSKNKTNIEIIKGQAKLSNTPSVTGQTALNNSKPIGVSIQNKVDVFC
jgi:hypothetical protein